MVVTLPRWLLERLAAYRLADAELDMLGGLPDGRDADERQAARERLGTTALELARALDLAIRPYGFPRELSSDADEDHDDADDAGGPHLPPTSGATP